MGFEKQQRYSLSWRILPWLSSSGDINNHQDTPPSFQRRTQDSVIALHPTAHTDRFLRAWLDYTAGLFGTPKESRVAPIYAALTARGAQGQCTKCHSVEQESTGDRLVKWRPRRLERKKGGFTVFSHAPHFGALGERGCTVCHKLDSKAKYQETYGKFDPSQFASNFGPIKRAVCTECHVQASAGENCLLCHNYHVNEVSTRVMATTLPGRTP